MISSKFSGSAADCLNVSSAEKSYSDSSSDEENSNDPSTVDKIRSRFPRTSTASSDETSGGSSFSSCDEGEFDGDSVNFAISLGNIFMNSIDQVDTCSSECSCTNSSTESMEDDTESEDDTLTENSSTSHVSDNRSFNGSGCEVKAEKHMKGDILNVPSDEISCDGTVEERPKKDTSFFGSFFHCSITAYLIRRNI